MKEIEFFKKLRDLSGEIVQAHDDGDIEKFESALGKFALLMIEMECLK